MKKRSAGITRKTLGSYSFLLDVAVWGALGGPHQTAAFLLSLSALVCGLH
jgi:hypothetical protein